MHIQLIRHATLLIGINGRNILVDPMLSPAGELDPAANAANARRNPLIELPPGLPSLEQVDAVLVTHTHRDHFDAAAAEQVPGTMPLFCQPEDREKFIELGFQRVMPIDDRMVWQGIRIARTKGRHGRGEMGRRMGPVSGYVLEAAGEPVLYITGDTVWCPETEEALAVYRPDVAVACAGAAQFLAGGTITMGAEDIAQFCRASPATKVVAVHMEAWNHCLLTRRELAAYAREQHVADQVLIPEDGERLEFR